MNVEIIKRVGQLGVERRNVVHRGSQIIINHKIVGLASLNKNVDKKKLYFVQHIKKNVNKKRCFDNI